VAIPAYFFHRYFRGLVGDYVVDMEKDVIVLMDELSAHSEAAAPVRAARPHSAAAPIVQETA
jgi:biopolymer transport protein ExbB